MENQANERTSASPSPNSGISFSPEPSYFPAARYPSAIPATISPIVPPVPADSETPASPAQVSMQIERPVKNPATPVPVSLHESPVIQPQISPSPEKTPAPVIRQRKFSFSSLAPKKIRKNQGYSALTPSGSDDDESTPAPVPAPVPVPVPVLVPESIPAKSCPRSSPSTAKNPVKIPEPTLRIKTRSRNTFRSYSTDSEEEYLSPALPPVPAPASRLVPEHRIPPSDTLPRPASMAPAPVPASVNYRSDTDTDSSIEKARIQRNKEQHQGSNCLVSGIQINCVTLDELMDESSSPLFMVCASIDSSNKKSPALPESYKKYADVFDKKSADMLPEHRPYDCSIDLEPNAKTPFGPIYSLSREELEALREYIDENLAKGFIRHSKSPAASPVLFVKKKDGSLRLCVDYRALNKVTVKNRYPIPLISELLDRLGEAKIFTKIDLRGAYNLVRIKPGDEWKTAFRTRYGHFEYLVMPFGLTNAPAVFQHMMNDIFREYLDRFVVVYLDDILVYSANAEEHQRHVRLVLEKLRAKGLYAKLEKCYFDQKSVEFLGYIVGEHGTSMDPEKVKSIMEWNAPKSLRDVQCFLGFANFYRQFIKDYSKIVAPLVALTKRSPSFKWNDDAQRAFDLLKERFSTAPVLAHADLEKPFIVETDGSDFALGAVLSQIQSDGELHPVAFYSRKFTPAEINYEIYDKELLAIICAFQVWRKYLEGSPHKIVVYSDHKNLEYFMTTRTLNRRQARWSMFLSSFDFVILFRPGKMQGKPDALSRRSEYQPKPDDPCILQQRKALLSKDRIMLSAAAMEIDEDLMQDIKNALKDDPFVKKIMKFKPREFVFQDDILLRKGLIYVPSDELRLRVLRFCHDAPLAGHFGANKTIELITRNFWWPKLADYVKDYVSSCDPCNRSKPRRGKPFGELVPIPIPSQPWKSISMDFITDLPRSQGYDSILVVVDRFTKMAHFIPCKKSITAVETAKLVLSNIVRLHGVPDEIISDRGPQFASKFWKELLTSLGVRVKLSSAFHPETDGQSERVNQILEQYLRCSVNYLQDNWVDLAPLAEFAYNNSVHRSTGMSPFFLNYGHHPRFGPSASMFAPNPTANELVTTLQRAHDLAREQIKKAQAQYKYHADKKREPTPDIKPGDYVWLVSQNVQTTRPCRKLDYKKLGPFEVTEKINPVAFRLKLPPAWRIHDVFHVSLLVPFKRNRFSGRHLSLPPPDIINDAPEYEVEEILDSKIYRKKLYYLVHWKGYDISERTWEPTENLENAKELVSKFHHQNPSKPKKRQL